MDRVKEEGTGWGEGTVEIKRLSKCLFESPAELTREEAEMHQFYLHTMNNNTQPNARNYPSFSFFLVLRNVNFVILSNINCIFSKWHCSINLKIFGCGIILEWQVSILFQRPNNQLPIHHATRKLSSIFRTWTSKEKRNMLLLNSLFR